MSFGGGGGGSYYPPPQQPVPPRTTIGPSTAKVQQDLLERRRRAGSRRKSRIVNPLGSGPLYEGGGNLSDTLSDAQPLFPSQPVAQPAKVPTFKEWYAGTGRPNIMVTGQVLTHLMGEYRREFGLPPLTETEDLLREWRKK